MLTSAQSQKARPAAIFGLGLEFERLTQAVEQMAAERAAEAAAREALAERARRNSSAFCSKVKAESQEAILTQLRSAGRQSTQAIADAIGRERSSVFKNLRDMEARGVVLRVGNGKRPEWLPVTPSKTTTENEK